MLVTLYRKYYLTKNIEFVAERLAVLISNPKHDLYNTLGLEASDIVMVSVLESPGIFDQVIVNINIIITVGSVVVIIAVVILIFRARGGGQIQGDWSYG